MSADSESSGEIDAGPGDAEVVEYLKANRDFFERHPDMLDHLHISHGSGDAASLVEKQVSVLRERNVDIRRRLAGLTDNARDNDALYELTRKLVLELLESTTLEELAAAFMRSMTEDFEVEHAGLILFGDPSRSSGPCRVESAESARVEIGALIKGGTAVRGPLREREASYLFPAAGGVGSAAVMPLRHGGELGVIAIGSSDAHYYSADMGTLFLGHIADVLARLIPGLQRRERPGHQ